MEVNSLGSNAIVHDVRTFLIDRNALVVNFNLTNWPNVSEYSLFR